MVKKSDRPPELVRWLLPVFILAIVGAVLVYAKDEVDRRLARSGGAWAIQHESLPDWFPIDFGGELAKLQAIPSQVSLQTIRWREDTSRELIQNPWIASVERIERTPAGIGFKGQFNRPSLGIRCENGWLLVDGVGKVIDFQEGDFLSEAWRIPEYIPEQGTLHKFDSGQIVEGSEFSELFSIAGLLWQERIFDRVPGFLREIAMTRDPVGERLWKLHTDIGIPLNWGRSPASGAPKVASVEKKLICLRQVIEVRDRLRKSQGIQEISLCSGDEPLVIEDW